MLSQHHANRLRATVTGRESNTQRVCRYSRIKSPCKLAESIKPNTANGSLELLIIDSSRPEVVNGHGHTPD